MNISLRRRILYSIAIITTGLVALIALTLTQFTQILDETDKQIKLVNSVLLTKEIKYNVVQIQQFITDASLTGESDALAEAKQNLTDALEHSQNLINNNPNFTEQIEKLKLDLNNLNNTGLTMFEAYTKQGKEAGNAIMIDPEKGFDVASEKLATNFNQVANQLESEIEKSLVNIKTLENRAINYTALASLIIGILVTISLITIYRKVSPLDLIILDLKNKSEEIQNASDSTSSMSTNLKDSVNQQASALQETASAIEEITQMVKSTEDNAISLENAVDISLNVANNGRQTFDEVSGAMKNIDNSIEQIMSQVNEGNQRMLEISRLIAEIGDKTKVINDIVFQTKLLSFNASVEAARAGEHGKGFAVVAEEVGNLATMSGTASKEISDILSSSIEKVQSFVKEQEESISSLIKNGKQTMEEGHTTLQKGSEALDQIVSENQKVKELVGSISLAVKEQTTGIIEISKAIQLLDSTSQRSKTTADGSSVVATQLLSTSDELNAQADNLAQLVLGDSNTRLSS